MIFFFNDTATTEIYTLSLHDALPISLRFASGALGVMDNSRVAGYGYECSSEIVGHRGTLRIDNHRRVSRSEEHTSELQSRQYLVCRLLLEKKEISVERVIALADLACG